MLGMSHLSLFVEFIVLIDRMLEKNIHHNP